MFRIDGQTANRLRIALWALVGLEFLCTLIVLGVAGSLPPVFVHIGLSGPPGKVVYNIVCAVFTFLIFLAVIPLVYFKPGFWTRSVDRWAPWPAVGAHVLATIFWIASAGSAFLSCPDLCGLEPTGNSYFVHWSTVCCTCPNAVQVKCGDGTGASRGFNVDLGDATIGERYQLNQVFNILQMLFFMATATILLVQYFGNPDHASDNPFKGVSQYFSSSRIPETAKEPMRHTVEVQSEPQDSPYQFSEYPRQPPPRAYQGA